MQSVQSYACVCRGDIYDSACMFQEPLAGHQVSDSTCIDVCVGFACCEQNLSERGLSDTMSLKGLGEE